MSVEFRGLAVQIRTYVKGQRVRDPAATCEHMELMYVHSSLLCVCVVVGHALSALTWEVEGCRIRKRDEMKGRGNIIKRKWRIEIEKGGERVITNGLLVPPVCSLTVWFSAKLQDEYVDRSALALYAALME